MSNNLAAYFASSNNTTDNNNNNNINNSNTRNHTTTSNSLYDDDDDMGPSVSMAIEADNDEDFHNLTFKLKRTQSMGLLDPTNPIAKNNSRSTTTTTTTTYNNKQQLPTPNIIDYDAHSDDYDYDANNSDISSNSSDSSSNISDDLVLNNGNTTGDDDQDNFNVGSYTQSSSVSPPAPDDDKLLPQDDNDVVREPQRHVDYLSHHWKESDISNSWKYIIAKKKKRDIDVVNTARLENASWRTWAKARNNLKTVSPEILNWSKDSDVTWLYGPIVRSDNFNNSSGNSHRKRNKIHSKDDYRYDDNDDYDDDYDDDDDDDDDNYERGYGSDGDETSIRLPSTNSSIVNQSNTTSRRPHSSRREITPKPILKRRTVPEIIEENAQWRLNEARKHFNEVRRTQSIKNRDIQTNVHDDYDLLAAKVNAQYFNYPSSSSSSNTASNKQQQIYSSNHNNNNNDNISQTCNDTQANSSNAKYDIPSYTTNQSGNLNISDEKDKKANDSSITNSTSPTKSNVTVLNSNHRNIYTVSQDNSSSNIKNGTLSSILTTSSGFRSKNNNNDKTDISNNNNIKKPNKDRHIHFNDRVEQCMVVKYPSNPSDEDMESGFYSSDDDYNQEFSDYSNSESNSDSSDGENDDEHGLFISARFSRRLDSLAHSPITDNSSIGSNCTSGRHNSHIRPIIKMLPATTLNYGSDDESDNNDFNSGYGNAISHNVNTQRGYDYIYDYNSVYTGDTSSFLPVDPCDIIDVPEGINLQTAIADDNQETYKLLSPSDTKSNQPTALLSPATSNDQYYNSGDDQYSISSNTDDDQFIEDSQYHSSNSGSDSSSSDNEDYLQMGSKCVNSDLGLKRTVSIGRSNNSLVGLSLNNNSNQQLKSTLSQTFLNGSSLARQTKSSNNTLADTFQNKNEIPLSRNASKGFIFSSDSEEESDEALCITDVKENNSNQTHKGDLNLNSLEIKPCPRRKLGPPQRSSSSLLLNNINQAGKYNIDKSIKIPSNTVSSTNISPNNVTIEGSFPPRNDSEKSVMPKEKLTNYNNS
ncbi:protein phosphatase regulator REG1 PWA37_003755 [Arxiozyma heterogenica]|uniref:protein phosphatase regulator REG1 n=1 Tax=Arxiozyma heterogenica TaxID=278026 RepID=UPI002EF121AD